MEDLKSLSCAHACCNHRQPEWKHWSRNLGAAPREELVFVVAYTTAMSLFQLPMERIDGNLVPTVIFKGQPTTFQAFVVGLLVSFAAAVWTMELRERDPKTARYCRRFAVGAMAVTVAILLWAAAPAWSLFNICGIDPFKIEEVLYALASVEAGQEKESLLNSTIKDLENLIEGLKSKVSKAESQAESAEDKCIILSESNSDLNEELSFLRGRVECLEASLHQAEETKRATAKDISIRTKLITELVMQLALERERLQKQISSLRKENNFTVKHLQQTNNSPINISLDGKGTSLLSKHDFTTASCTKESKREATEFSATSFELDNTLKKFPCDESEMMLAETTSKLESTRNIDARQLNFKYVFLAILVLVTSVFAAVLLHLNGRF